MDKTKNQQLAAEMTDFCKKRIQTKTPNAKSRLSGLFRLVFALLAAPVGPDADDKHALW